MKEKIPMETTCELMRIVAKGDPSFYASVTKLVPSMLTNFVAFFY